MFSKCDGDASTTAEFNGKYITGIKIEKTDEVVTGFAIQWTE